MTIRKGTTKAGLELAINTQVSGPPMSGQWQIKCVYPDGAYELTKKLNLDSSDHTIQRHISEHCPLFRNRILVHSYSSPFPHHTLGREFYIDFSSYPGDPGQFEVISNEDNPLVGDITYNAETIVPYGKNLMFWPIPFEMLETYEEKPQMLVEIDDMPAVCHSMECSFMHIPAVGEVTQFAMSTLDGVSTLTLTGTELPDNVSKIQSIKYAGSLCTPVTPVIAEGEEGVVGTLSGTEVVCTLDREPTCGTNWIPNLTTFFGDVANADSVTGQDVACTITSVVPDTPLNLLGKDNITFTGTNFPHEIEGNTFELKFDNNMQTVCDVVDTKTTDLVCLTNKFNLISDLDIQVGISVIINGKTLDNTL